MRNRLFALLFLVCAAMGSPTFARAATPLTDLTVFFTLTRLYYDEAKKLVPFMHSRVATFLAEGAQVQFTAKSNPNPHYQKMMHEMMISYDVLQRSKPYITSVLFNRFSREWQFVHDRVILSQKYYAHDKAASSKFLAEALRDAGKVNFILKSLDVIL